MSTTETSLRRRTSRRKSPKSDPMRYPATRNLPWRWGEQLDLFPPAVWAALKQPRDEKKGA